MIKYYYIPFPLTIEEMERRRRGWSWCGFATITFSASLSCGRDTINSRHKKKKKKKKRNKCLRNRVIYFRIYFVVCKRWWWAGPTISRIRIYNTVYWATKMTPCITKDTRRRYIGRDLSTRFPLTQRVTSQTPRQKKVPPTPCWMDPKQHLTSYRLLF